MHGRGMAPPFCGRTQRPPPVLIGQHAQQLLAPGRIPVSCTRTRSCMGAAFQWVYLGGATGGRQLPAGNAPNTAVAVTAPVSRS